MRPGLRASATSIPLHIMGWVSQRPDLARPYPNDPRDEYLISTKVGRVLEPNPGYSPGTLDDEGFCVPATVRRRWDPSEAGIRRSLEESLERLGMDRLDIAYLHDPDAYSLDAGIDQALPALEKLKREGLVGAILRKPAR